MKQILVAVDFSDSTTQIIDTALKLARKFESEVTLTHVSLPPELTTAFNTATQELPGLYPPGTPYSDLLVIDALAEENQHNLEQEQQQLQEIVKKIDYPKLNATLVEGPILGALLKQIEELKPDLVVLGSHEHSAMRKAILGSVSEGILENGGCPVLIIPPVT